VLISSPNISLRQSFDHPRGRLARRAPSSNLERDYGMVMRSAGEEEEGGSDISRSLSEELRTSISFSNRPPLRKQGSTSFGRFVVAMMAVLGAKLASPSIQEQITCFRISCDWRESFNHPRPDLQGAILSLRPKCINLRRDLLPRKKGRKGSTSSIMTM
jgi:hypothetical protein